jgi:hypothetical protein
MVDEYEDVVQIKNCQTVDEFLDFLNIANPIWLPGHELTSSWVFRGQRKSAWTLLPRAFRKCKEENEGDCEDVEKEWFRDFKDEQVDKINDLIRDKATVTPRLFELILQMAAEWKILEEFVDLADDVGHAIPEDGRMARGRYSLKTVIDELSPPSFIGALPESIELSLAQHHGIPTRLIDWTTMPYAAAFFAAEQALTNESDLASQYQIAVWAINTAYIDSDPFDYSKATDLRVVRQRRGKISYLHAQGGLFIYDLMANKYFIEHEIWRSFEEAIRARNPVPKERILRKVTLPATLAANLLHKLLVQSKTRAHLMPTYDNITYTLRLNRLISKKLKE